MQKRRDSKCCSVECIKKHEYTKRDKDKKRHYEQEREYKKRGAGGSHTLEEWNFLKAIMGNRCSICYKECDKLTKDHIIPIVKGGSNNIENIQPLCLSCNSRKGSKILNMPPLTKGDLAIILKRLNLF